MSYKEFKKESRSRNEKRTKREKGREFCESERVKGKEEQGKS